MHVSPCGKHFVTTDELGYVCIVRNFEEAIRCNTPLQDYLTVIDMGYPVMNLALEDDKRIVVYVDVRHFRWLQLCNIFFHFISSAGGFLS